MPIWLSPFLPLRAANLACAERKSVFRSAGDPERRRDVYFPSKKCSRECHYHLVFLTDSAAGENDRLSRSMQIRPFDRARYFVPCSAITGPLGSNAHCRYNRLLVYVCTCLCWASPARVTLCGRRWFAPSALQAKAASLFPLPTWPAWAPRCKNVGFSLRNTYFVIPSRGKQKGCKLLMLKLAPVAIIKLNIILKKLGALF
jgi:hypothetical protein